MKIELDFEIPIEITKKGKVVEILSIYYREYTKKEKTEQNKLIKKITKIQKKNSKLLRKIGISDKKLEAYRELGKYESFLRETEKQEGLEEELDGIEEELEQLGGGDQIQYLETISKQKFDTLVSGKDVERLKEYAESMGYTKIINLVDKAKEELLKKPYGE